MTKTFKLRRDGRVEFVGGENDGVVADPCPCGEPLRGTLCLVKLDGGGQILCHPGCVRKKAK